MSFIDGLSSGLDTTSIITQLMAIERRPQNALKAQRDIQAKARDELASIRSDVNALRDLAADFRLNQTLRGLTATSSNPTAVSVTAGTAKTTGTYSFEVTSVATAASMYSTSVYASLDTVVTTPGADVFQASGFESLGFSALSGTGFNSGDVAFQVVQDSAVGTLTGSSLAGGPYTIDGSNDTLSISVDGTNYTLTLAHGSYADHEELSTALADAIAAHGTAGDVVTAGTDGTTSGITLSTIAEGSDHNVKITGGNAMAALGFTILQTGTGVDGIVEVDGLQTTITDVTEGQVVTLNSGVAGSIDATIGTGGIRTGSAAVTNGPEPGSGGTLADLIAEVNESDLGYTAIAVNTGSGYRLQLTADTTGAASSFTPDPDVFEGMGFTVLSAGSDAELTVQGDTPYTVTSSQNTFKELLPGVSVTVHQKTTGPVTVSTAQDTEGVTEKVGEFVTKFNELLTKITEATRNTPGGQRTVLQGNREARRAADELRNALFTSMDDHPLTSVGLVGIELTRDGAITFNESKFAAALEADADDVASLFVDQGSGADEAPGALDRVIEAAEFLAATGKGLLATSAEASDRLIVDYDRQIESYERRLQVREENLRRTYANLEVALGALAEQSSYIASQLANLPTASSGRNRQ